MSGQEKIDFGALEGAKEKATWVICHLDRAHQATDLLSARIELGKADELLRQLRGLIRCQQGVWLDNLMEKVEELEKRMVTGDGIGRLKDAICQYGEHHSSCPTYGGKNDFTCTCGFERALELAKGNVQPVTDGDASDG